MVRRVLATTAAVAALAVLPAPPASAGRAPVSITVTGAYTGVFVSGLQIAASCEAVVAGAVSATVIEWCYLTSNGINHPSTLPGNATSSNFVERVTTLDFTLCYGAYTIPIDDPTNRVWAFGCATGTGDVDPGLADVDMSGLAGAGSSTTTA